YFILVGIALLYARTGALNFAQIGRTLAGQKSGGVEIVALTLILVGFLIKAAIVPFHFWLADAHAAAPAPVCVLFSGAMVELGLACGVLLAEFRKIDELRLFGRGRALPGLGVLFGLGAVGLMGLPYIGSYLGHAEIDEGATLHHLTWLPPLLMIASAVSSAAILRAGARVFLGWRSREDWLLTEQPPQDPPERDAHAPA